mmetsp:Transcript_3914/g.9489  ORF Transcript_3914/g.9489 Transcript_3914/m.9489 type:complete len:133 (-) Transcript_3914:3624-4022(-)
MPRSTLHDQAILAPIRCPTNNESTLFFNRVKRADQTTVMGVRECRWIQLSHQHTMNFPRANKLAINRSQTIQVVFHLVVDFIRFQMLVAWVDRSRDLQRLRAPFNVQLILPVHYKGAVLRIDFGNLPGSSAQ